MDRSAYLDTIAAESAAFHAAVAATPLGAPVPACPDWTVADLVYHLGEVHYFWGQIAERRLSAPDDVETPARPPDDELVDWARAQAEHLQEVLAAADPAVAVWTWAAQQDIAFIQRRMAQETAVHRWDAQSAAGEAGPIDAAIASDGVDEFLTHMLPDARTDRPPISGSVHLHATDTPGEWLVREEDGGGLTVTAEHTKGDAAVRGPASDLLLVLWRRKGLDEVEVLGDRSVAERLVGHTNLE
jgi:uncharacterized protein (TIGR03083 family)